MAAALEVAVRTVEDWEGERRKMPLGLWTYYQLLCAFPREMQRLLRKWRSGNAFAE